jgi:hypothetical protein
MLLPALEVDLVLERMRPDRRSCLFNVGRWQRLVGKWYRTRSPFTTASRECAFSGCRDDVETDGGAGGCTPRAGKVGPRRNPGPYFLGDVAGDRREAGPDRGSFSGTVTRVGETL